MWFLLLVACTSPLGDLAEAPTRPTGEALDDAWLRLVAETEDWRLRMGADAAAIAVLVDGRLRYAEGLGEVDGEPVEADALFRWASVSKPHVATAIHQLADDGIVHLDDPLSAFLPAFGPWGPWEELDPTLGQLLEHSASLPDRLYWKCESEDSQLRETFDGRWQPPLLAPPGAVFNYSNTNFSALGAVLEEVTGEPFPDAMEHEVLGPLGMRTATYRAEEAEALGAIVGHGGKEGAFEYDLSEWDCATSRPPAWLHASVLDLARFAQHTLGPDVSPSLVGSMEGGIDTRWWGDGGNRMGRGFYRSDYRDRHTLWSHDGWVTGFASHIALLPEEGLGVVLITNRDDANSGGLRNTALDLFLGYEDAGLPHVPLFTGIEAKRRWVGTYQQPIGDYAPEHAVGDFVVDVAGNELVITFSGWPTTGLFQADGDAFGYVIDDVVHYVRFFESYDEVLMVHRGYVGRRTSTTPDYPEITPP